MKIQDLFEGMYVVKNKDGKEKRFKDAGSEEAVQWKNSSSAKSAAKVAAYSDAYWDDKNWKANSRSFVTPWTKIGDAPKDGDEVEKIVKDQFSFKNIDWEYLKAGETKVEGTTCATQEIRVMYEVGPEDDMGFDDTVQDAQNIFVVRDRQDPKKIKFLKYGN